MSNNNIASIDKEDGDEDGLVLENGIADMKFLQSKGEKYAVEMVDKLLRINGVSGKEQDVLKFILGEVAKSNDFEKLRILFDIEIGLIVVVPAMESTEQMILVEAHCDTVMDYSDSTEYTNPKYSIHKDSRVLKGEEFCVVEGTGLDNRICCALLLAMVRFRRYKNIGFCAFFSVEEENGFIGVKKLASNNNLFDFIFKDIDSEEKIRNVDLIVVLDVESGLKVEWSEGNDHAVIGKGAIPIHQGFTTTNYNDMCTINGFRTPLASEIESMYHLVPKIHFALACAFMHEKSSFASISDLLDLLRFFNVDFERIMEESKSILSHLKVEVSKRKKSFSGVRTALGSKITELIKQCESLHQELSCSLTRRKKTGSPSHEFGMSHESIRSKVQHWTAFSTKWMDKFSERFEESKKEIGFTEDELENIERTKKELVELCDSIEEEIDRFCGVVVDENNTLKNYLGEIKDSLPKEFWDISY